MNHWILRAALVGIAVVSAAAVAPGADSGWTVVHDANFAAMAAGQQAPLGWSHRGIVTAPDGKLRVLGKFGAEPVTLRLPDLPAHKFLRVRLAVEPCGNWGEESWRLQVAGGPTLATAAVSPCTPPMQGGPLLSRGSIVSVCFAHTASSVELAFSAPKITDVDRLWWGLRWVKVEAAGAVTPADDKTLAEAWADLERDQFSINGAGQETFVLAADKGAKLLLERMTAVGDVERVRELIRQTDDAKYAVREKASEALTALGRSAEPEIRAAMAKEGISHESKNRLEKVLEGLGIAQVSPEEWRRQYRGVNALRLIGSSEAKAALRKLVQVSAWPEVRGAAAEAVDEIAETEIGVLLAAAESATQKGEFAAAAQRCRDANAVSVEADGLAAMRVADMLRLVEQREKTGGEIDKLRARVAADAKDAMARMELVWLLLREMDQPAEAAKWLNDAIDAKIREMATLAAKRAQDVPQERRLDLARWYRTTATQASAAARPPLLRRAAKLVELYLTAETSGPSREKASAELSEIQHETMVADSVGEGWTDLLKQVDLAKGVRSGEWKRDGRGVKLASGSFGTLELPAQPNKSYELRVQFNRSEGKDGIFVAVPAGTHRGNLNISGWDGECSGLEWIDSKEANANESTIKQPGIVNGRNHLLVVRVTLKDDEADVQTTLDGKAYVKWKGKAERLSTASAWSLPDGTSLAIGAHQSDIRFLSVRVREFEAKGK